MDYSYDQELYYRGVSYFRKILTRLESKKVSTPLPGVPRKSEKIIVPVLKGSANRFCFFVGCCIYSCENDFATSEILNHYLKEAQRHRFVGEWEIWLHYINYFNIEGFDIKDKNKVETCFDIPSIFDFLQDHYSDDEIFGNILNRAAKILSATFRVRDRYRPSSVPVNYPQRKRGYTDKGSIAPYDAKARREANLSADTKDRRCFDSMLQIQTWGPTYKRQ